MKKFFLISFFLLIGFAASSNQGVYFLDVDYLLNNSNKGKLIIDKLQKINEENLIKLKKKEERLKSTENDILTKKNVISENEFQENVNEFNKELNLFEKERIQIVNNFNSIKMKELDIFFKK